MARRLANKLTAREVATLSKEGWHGDGAGLWLRVGKDGRCAWTFIYRINGKRFEMGLGAARGIRAVSLQAAREAAQAARSCVARGGNPLLDAKASTPEVPVASLETRPLAVVPTFGDLAEEYLRDMSPKWKNAKHAAQWQMTLRQYAKPLADKRVDGISTNDVLECLKPHWRARPETASRLRNRIELVLDAATARGFRTGTNPAAWRGNLKALLPARQKLTRGHHAALPYKQLPEFMKALRARGGFAAKALEFCILTAARTGEVLQARWDQIDIEDGVWTVPAAAMKAGREHRVPLSRRAQQIIQEMRDAQMGEFVFPASATRGLSNMAMAQLLKRMGVKATVHGFRSSFRDWAGEVSTAPNEVAEMALAHTIANKAEAAYRRGDLLEKRKALMEAWAAWCEPKTDHRGNVVSLHGAARQ